MKGLCKKCSLISPECNLPKLNMKKLCLCKYIWAWLSVLLHLISTFYSQRYLVKWKPHTHMNKYRKDKLRVLKFRLNLPSVIWQDVRCCFLKLNVLNIKRTPHFQFLCSVSACVCLPKTIFHCIYLTAWKLQINGEKYKSLAVKDKMIRRNKFCWFAVHGNIAVI